MTACRMSIGGAACAEGADPRMVGRCYRCDRQIAAPSRDRDFEATAIRRIAAGLGVNVEPLVRFACQRADAFESEYGHDFPDLNRDLEREGLEEAADWANYIVWRLDAIRRDMVEGQEWKVGHLQDALKHVALAFEATRAARG